MNVRKNRHDRKPVNVRRSAFCLFLTAVLLGGCTPRNVTRGMAEGEAYDAVISVRGAQEETDASEGVSDETAQEDVSGVSAVDLEQTASDSEELLALAGLLGKTDGEAAEAFGGGAENRTEDGEVLVGRSYETEFFGKACSVHTSYDDTGLVWLVTAEPKGTDSGELRDRIRAVTGSEPEEVTEETGEGRENPGKTLDWNWEGIGVSLYEAEEGVSISISLSE